MTPKMDQSGQRNGWSYPPKTYKENGGGHKCDSIRFFSFFGDVKGECKKNFYQGFIQNLLLFYFSVVRFSSNRRVRAYLTIMIVIFKVKIYIKLRFS